MTRRSRILVLILLAVLLAIPSAAVASEGRIPGLTPEEELYLRELGAVTMCVDPDWYPYELVDENGEFIGIAADLVEIVSERLSIPFEIVPTADWAETLEYSKAGRCHLIPFLNQTPAREEWLLFTDPIFTDPNVFVTREEFPYISDPAELVDRTVALPYGTSMEEFLREDYPNLIIVHTVDEIEAFRMVQEREADMTLRSLMVASYIIRSEGFFNLKIAGSIPEYTNNLRMGVLREMPMLRDILNKAIATITPREREATINAHVYVRMETPFDYRRLIGPILAASTLALAVFARLLARQRRKLEMDLLERTRELQESEQRYRDLSGLDGLTGIPNRRTFDEVFGSEWNRAVRARRPLSLLMIDIDHFKAYNDNYGHPAGDEALVAVAGALRTALKRSTDFVARYGGEEFAVVLPEAGEEDARQAAGKVREAVAALGIAHAHSGTASHLTVSIGAATLHPRPELEPHALAGLADRALYESKRGGRDSIVVKTG